MKRFGCYLVVLLLFATFASPAFSVGVEGYRPLQYGDSGEEVALVQEQLTMLGYYEGKVSGNYLDGTQQAVLRFQQDFGLEATGVTDGETEAMLFSIEYRQLTTGDTGDDVKRIQERLIALDYYKGKVSGDYLEGTTFGIETFQEKNGLEATGTDRKSTRLNSSHRT